MKIQLSPRKRVEDALCIWPAVVNDVDIAIDFEKAPLPLRPSSVASLYCFGALRIMRPENIQGLLDSIFLALKPGGTVYLVEPEFSHLARAYTEGTLKIEEMNDMFHGTKVDKDLLVKHLKAAGFPEGTQRVWFADGIKFAIAAHEVVISGTKSTK